MARYTQAGRSIMVTTPLGEDVLLLVGFQGFEAVSQLFSFKLDLLAENASKVEFDKLMGQKITITLTLPGGGKRYLNGICIRFSQGVRDKTFTSFRMEIVPQFWLLTRLVRSRIFQHVNVPDILKQVLAALDVDYQIVGTFEPRDYCAQYRESDFSFASRLMEEEGLYYFFKHTAQGHQMVIANTPQGHPDMPDPNKLIFEGTVGGTRDEDRIFEWDKVQDLRSGKCTLWDHCFELPGKNLEAVQAILDSVTVGKVTHKLKVGGNDKLEVYDYPGEYAQRFDGVDKSGGEQPAELQKIFQDNARTVGIRMQQEALPSLVIQGVSKCRHLVSGHKFTLERHFDADGQYVLTSLEHTATLAGDYRSGEDQALQYENRFTCIPFALPFRPLRLSPKPTVQGSQTAIVVGPPGEEIFTDKYGRVKVQFPWDRENNYNPDSSCWVRVGTLIAGRQWGMIQIPRIGQEVIVDFLEGDPDRPIIVGCVYNADQMPPYTLPDHKTKSCFKSYSSLGGGGFNEIRFEDKKGEEQVFVHGQKDMDIRVKNDRREFIGRDRHLHVARHKREHVKGSSNVLVGGDLREKIGGDHHQHIKGKQAIQVDETLCLFVMDNVAVDCDAQFCQLTLGEHSVTTQDKLILRAAQAITLVSGGNFIKIDPSGVWIQGTMVYINSGGSPDSATSVSTVAPADPAVAELADQADPGSKAPSYKQQRAALSPTEQNALDAPVHDPDSEESKQKKSWIEIELIDEEKNPVPGESYQVTLPDGTTIASGTLDAKGYAKIDHIDPGTCKVTFPDMDKDAWEPVGQGGGGESGGTGGSGSKDSKDSGSQDPGSKTDAGSQDSGSKKDSGYEDTQSEKEADDKGSQYEEPEYKVGYDEDTGLPQPYSDRDS